MFPRWGNISLGICVSQVGELISLGICVSHVREHISIGVCVFQVGEHISLGICVSPVDEHISLGICVSEVGEHRSLEIFVSQMGDHISLGICVFLLCHTPVFPLTLHVFCVFYYFHQLQHSHLYLPSLCATAFHALYFVFFILITLITSYTLYVSPLLCALLYRHFLLSFPFSLLGPLLLCFFFCSKHQGRVVQSRVKITQG